MEFSEGSIIRVEGKQFECIIANDKLAVFGEIETVTKEKYTVSYEKLSVYHQERQEGFEFQECIGRCENCGQFIFDGDGYDIKSEPEIQNQVEATLIVHKKCPQ